MSSSLKQKNTNPLLVQQNLLNFSKAENYSTDISLYEEDETCQDEKERRIMKFLMEENVLCTNAYEKMYNFFQNKREKILEARKQLSEEMFCSTPIENKSENLLEVNNPRKSFAQRKSLFLMKI